MDLYDHTTTAPQDVQGPSTNSMNNISTKIKDILNQEIEDITSEVKAQAFRITKLEDYRRYEDEYATNLGILHAEFGRVRGSADNFAKLQADALKDYGKILNKALLNLDLFGTFSNKS